MRKKKNKFLDKKLSYRTKKLNSRLTITKAGFVIFLLFDLWSQPQDTRDCVLRNFVWFFRGTSSWSLGYACVSYFLLCFLHFLFFFLRYSNFFQLRAGFQFFSLTRERTLVLRIFFLIFAESDPGPDFYGLRNLRRCARGDPAIRRSLLSDP